MSRYREFGRLPVTEAFGQPLEPFEIRVTPPDPAKLLYLSPKLLPG
jgi:hypothetical protein